MCLSECSKLTCCVCHAGTLLFIQAGVPCFWMRCPAEQTRQWMAAQCPCLLLALPCKASGLQTTGTEAQTDTESAIGARSGMYRPIAAAAAAAASLEPL